MRKIETTSVFERALQADTLVYLFGTGISSALTGQRYSWRKWITDGIQLLKDTALAETLKAALEADPSTENMITVAGGVIQAAQAEGAYDRWMRQSFEANPISHGTLPATLKKLLLTQDVFATTNYDLLLEKATGLGTFTYEQPDLMFPMLEEKRSTHILHIHGVYDSAHGIDNIVASREQYRRVLEDKGAQFIQNLLGTRTLVLVGCGKTTEDANIAQFLRFAEEWLKLDRPCFFLYNTAQQFDDMPEHITMVPYGNCFEDLPPFLEHMAQIRLCAKIQGSPIVSRTASFGPKADAYGLAEYHFANESLKFCGRSRELAQLEVFAENDAPVKWWAVTGQAGVGKSRLAYEFLRRDRTGYFSFFLNCNAPIEATQQFQPFNNTFVIVDYVKGHELGIAEMTTLLMERFDSTPYKLRLLFLERDNQLLTGSWYQAMEASFGAGDRARFRDYEYNVAIASREHRFLYLEDLEEDAVEELIGEIFRKKGLPVDPHRCTQLKEEYRKRYERLKFRPLFLQLFVETYIDNGCVQADYRNCQELLQAVLRREQDRILRSVNDNYPVCAALIRLLVRAGVSGRLETDALPTRYQRDWDMVKEYNAASSLPGVQRREQLNSLIRDAEQGLDSEVFAIAPLYPDVIKEAMFLYYADEEDTPEIWAELWENCPAEFAEFLSRAVMDFSDHTGLRDMIHRASADYVNPYAMEARLALLQNETVRTVDEGPALFRQAQEEFAYWKGAPSGSGDARDLIALKGLDFSARQLIGWNADESRQALAEIASFPRTRSTAVYQIDSLLEHTHYFVERAAKAAQYTMQLTGPLIDALPEGRRKTLFWLRLQRERAVTLIQRRQFDTAWKVYENVYAAIQKTDEQMMELYAYTCFSCARESLYMLDYHRMLDYSYELQDMATAYASRAERVAFNDKIHYYYLHAKLMQCEIVTVGSALHGRTEIGLHYLDGLIQEIEGNEMIADFSGLLVGAWAVKVGADESVSDEQVRAYLERANEFLRRYPDNQVLAAKSLDLWETVYTDQFKQKVPASFVERGYMLLLRFPRDPAVIDGFHDLLEASEEAQNPRKYYSRREVVAGMIENNRGDYLLPAPTEAATYVRSHPKVGANDPCPCGSGRKFKKCCRGNGRYD